MIYLFLFIFFLVIIFYLLKVYIFYARKYKILDGKNLNYAFKTTITGSGITFIIVFLIGNLFFYLFFPEIKELYPNRYYFFLISLTILTTVSFVDDFYSLDPIFRLIVQIFFIYISLACLDLNQLNYYLKVIILFTLISWIYIMNITNFLDGADGFLTLNMFFFWLGFIYICSELELNYFLNIFH